MTKEATMDRLHQMRMTVMARAYREQEDAPGVEGMTFDERFAMLVDAEWDSRRSNKRVRLLRAASFAEPEANVMDVRYDADRKLDKGQIKELGIIVKADVQGSVEAVTSSLEKLTCDEVRVRVIHGAVGAISESDVMLASASHAIIVGFNVRPERAAAESAQIQGVDIRMYRIIYDCIEEMEQAMKGMLAPKYKEVVLGHAEVRTTFRVSGVGTIAGCYVQDGKIQRSAQLRVLRDNVVIHEGMLASLKRFKDDVKEVMSGYECGCGVENFNDIKDGDVFEAFVMEEVKP